MSEAAVRERGRDAERTRREILEVAAREFADRGFAGGRVDEIARQTRTTKRMLYYYFGSKEQLFVAVLERAYTRSAPPSRRSTSTISSPPRRSAGSPS